MMLRLGPIGAGVVGGLVGVLGTGLLVLLLDHVLPFLAGIPTPGPWMLSPGLVLAILSAPGVAIYLAGQLAAARATRVRHLVVAMAVAVVLLVAGWALALALLIALTRG